MIINVVVGRRLQLQLQDILVSQILRVRKHEKVKMKTIKNVYINLPMILSPIWVTMTIQDHYRGLEQNHQDASPMYALAALVQLVGIAMMRGASVVVAAALACA